MQEQPRGRRHHLQRLHGDRGDEKPGNPRGDGGEEYRLRHGVRGVRQLPGRPAGGGASDLPGLQAPAGLRRHREGRHAGGRPRAGVCGDLQGARRGLRRGEGKIGSVLRHGVPRLHRAGALGSPGDRRRVCQQRRDRGPGDTDLREAWDFHSGKA